MESGEREFRKAFEDTTTRNVRAAVDHGNESRRLVRELELKVASLEDTIRLYDTKLEALQKQITTLQLRIFSGGTE